MTAVCCMKGADVRPVNSIDFESSSSQQLRMISTNFGSYNRAKWAISVWVNRESLSGSNTPTIMTKGTNTANTEFLLQFTAADTLRIVTYKDTSSTPDGEKITTASYTTATWYHILIHFDSANGTASQRLRMWVNGSEIASFGVNANPTAQVQTNTAQARVGQYNGADAYFDGLIYQLSFFSGTLPSISDVYNAGVPKSVIGLPGLYSTLDVAGGDVTHDGVLATNWTNINSVVSSTTIPI